MAQELVVEASSSLCRIEPFTAAPSMQYHRLLPRR